MPATSLGPTSSRWIGKVLHAAVGDDGIIKDLRHTGSPPGADQPVETRAVLRLSHLLHEVIHLVEEIFPVLLDLLAQHRDHLFTRLLLIQDREIFLLQGLLLMLDGSKPALQFLYSWMLNLGLSQVGFLSGRCRRRSDAFGLGRTAQTGLTASWCALISKR